MRLFIAVSLTKEQRAALLAYQKLLAKTARATSFSREWRRPII